MLYGFDVGGTKIAFSVYDQSFNCLLTEQVSTPDNYDSFLSVIGDFVFNADKQFNCKGLIGIGLPGAVSPGDETINCANVNAISGRPLIKDLTLMLNREIKVENDANCFILSECYQGSANGCSVVLGITLGTGVGGAICINDKIVSGKNRFAAEIGHFPIPATILKKYPQLPDFTCGCGRDMCLETYVSGTGLSNLYQHYTNQVLQTPAIIDKYLSGDEIALEVMNQYFDILAAGIATSIMVLDPDAIVIGGGVSQLSFLIGELQHRLPDHLLKNVDLPYISNAKFGSVGGVRGAALLNA